MSVVNVFFIEFVLLKPFHREHLSCDTMSEMCNVFVDKMSCVEVRISLAKAELLLRSIHRHAPLGIFQYFLLMVCYKGVGKYLCFKIFYYQLLAVGGEGW